jgi:GTP-binding protein Era
LDASRNDTHRSGFCAIVGRPNVGKSTLLNRVLGQKIAIVTPKPQTTRNRILGVLTLPHAQVAFLDTPGIHRARGGLNRYMVDQALGAIEEVDVVLFLVEPPRRATPEEVRRPPGDVEQSIVRRLRAAKKKVILGINKVDAISKPLLLPMIDAWSERYDFASIVPFSALTGDGVDILVNAVVDELPEGPRLFPEDGVTDLAERTITAEFVREQILRHTHEEVPYGTAVVVESFDESERDGRNLVRIQARIYVERESQKGILIGKRGEMLKKIGTDARREIERLLGSRVFLGLEVVVEPRWSERREALRRLGYAE